MALKHARKLKVAFIGSLLLASASYYMSPKIRNFLIFQARRVSPANFFSKRLEEAKGGWQKYAHNPIVGESIGTCFDVCVVHVSEGYRMYFSWRPEKCIGTCVSPDGLHWSTPVKALDVNPGRWDAVVNRPSVRKVNNSYLMWYTGQFGGRGAAIGIASSKDGVVFHRIHEVPVIQSQGGWEGSAVMSPDVSWDSATKKFRMYYSGGEEFEPDAIGCASSSDGVNWQRISSSPIFTARPGSGWEEQKVTACQVLQYSGYYYMFYIGFQDIHTASIGFARSKDGITHWERSPLNPILRRGTLPRDWDFDSVYKPFAMQLKSGSWLLWYNGRNTDIEKIGVAIHPAGSLWTNGKRN